MSDLIKEQVFIMAIMTVCGLSTGLVYDTFQIFIENKEVKVIVEFFLQLLCFISIGFLIGKFFLYSDNGKLTMEGIISFGLGLLLWKKKLCGIICDKGERKADGQTKRKTSGIRKKQQSH